MLLFLIVALSWVAVVVAAVCVFRVAGYADRKVRRRFASHAKPKGHRFVSRAKPKESQAA